MLDGYNKFVVKNPSGCWGWTGCAPANPGYGQFRSRMKLIRAHRASWIIHYGDIPKGIQVLHKCDNRICSNPEHLFLGTQRNNMRDAIDKGRHPTMGAIGESNHMAKLTRDDVIEILRLISQNVQQSKIAKQFNVHPTRISDIKLGRTWSETTSRRAF